MKHELKCVEPYFQHILDGDKTFELRFNDRGFQKGDTLILCETNQRGYYSGRRLSLCVTYVLSGVWLADGHVAIGFQKPELKDITR